MIIIPARLKSTRLPNKMLCDLGGLPLIVQSALNAAKVDDVVVACDDEQILQVCNAHKIKCVMTDESHTSGTDRCAQAANILGLSNDEIVINVQGDEPFLESSVIETLIKLTSESGAFMSTLAKVIDSEKINDVNLVKVLLNANSEAIYFSRLGIPYARDGVQIVQNLGQKYLGHLGLYGFKKAALDEFCALPKTALEDIEKLEQLRALYHGKKIALKVVETKSIGIDTQEDLQAARQLLK